MSGGGGGVAPPPPPPPPAVIARSDGDKDGGKGPVVEITPRSRGGSPTGKYGLTINLYFLKVHL